MSAARAKGTLAETAVAGFLSQHGWPYAERRALAGALDKGDIAGVPRVAFEVKAARTLCIPAWLRETETERVNAGADHGLLVIKPTGVGVANVDQWWCVTRLEQAAVLLQKAGY